MPSSGAYSGFMVGSVCTGSAIFVYMNYSTLVKILKGFLASEEATASEELAPIAAAARSLVTDESSVATTFKDGSHAEQPKSSHVAVLMEQERTSFLTDMVRSLWSYINAMVCDEIRAEAEPMFKTMMPGPLATMHFTKLDLGSVPFTLDNIVVHEVDHHTNTLQVDIDVVWDGNCDIQLKADYVGSFGINHMKFRGRLNLLMKPLSPATVVSAMQYAFLDTPEVSLKYSGLASVADFSSIDSSIRKILQSTINSMMVLPRRRLYKVDRGCPFDKIYHPPVGVARITILNGRGFVIEKGLVVDDVPDAYCILSLGDLTLRSHVVENNLSPVWNAKMDFLVTDIDQSLKMEVWDEDKNPLDADDFLGSAATTPGEMVLSGKKVELPLHVDHQQTGAFVNLEVDMLKLSPDLSSLTNKEDNLLCGLITILVIGAEHIPLKREEASSFVRVTCGDHVFNTSAVVDYPGYDALNPSYNKSFLVHLTTKNVKNGKVPDVVFQLMNGVDTVLGELKFSHREMQENAGNMLRQTRKIGRDKTELQFVLCLQGVEHAGQSMPVDGPKTRGLLRAAGHDTSHRDAPFSAALDHSDKSTHETYIRITVEGGHGFTKHKEIFFIERPPDLYAKVKLGSNPEVWRTKTIQNTLNPIWNESKDFLLGGSGQLVNIELYDELHHKADNFLGSVRVTIGKVLLAGGSVEQELQIEGRGVGAYVSIRCQLVTVGA